MPLTRGTTTRRIWANIGWATAVLLTIGTGFVVGYGSIWLQLFGDRPDAGDYRISAGGYACAAVVLALGAVGILSFRGPLVLVGVSAAFAAVYVLLALRSVQLAAMAEPDDYGSALDGVGGALDGVGGVIGMPWTWPLVVLGVLGPIRSVRCRTLPGQSPS
jgi:hypothetical protein